jgi:hypothetical protein
MTNETPSTFQISYTARQSGYGCDRYKHVTFLTPEERTKVFCGERIYFRAARVSAKGPSGTFWRVAKVCGPYIGPRVPTPDEVAALRSTTGRK